jgi:hypothetical protein
MYFHINDFNLRNFREEIVSLFQNDDPIYNYDFQVYSIYYIHLFLPSGEIISRLPFRLFSLKDNEDIIEDIYLSLLPDVDIYLTGLEVIEYIEYSSYIGLYISKHPEEAIKPKDLIEYKDKYLSNRLMLYKKEYINNLKNTSGFTIFPAIK